MDMFAQFIEFIELWNKAIVYIYIFDGSKGILIAISVSQTRIRRTTYGFLREILQ
jgi:hypothetical protein